MKGGGASKWRLEEWVADYLLTCKIGQRFDERKDDVYRLLERRSGPIGAAIRSLCLMIDAFLTTER
jgi:hypothetical protein